MGADKTAPKHKISVLEGLGKKKILTGYLNKNYKEQTISAVSLTLVHHLSLTGGAGTGSYLGVFWQFSFFVRPPVGV